MDTEKAQKSIDLFVRDLGEILRSRARAYRHLWDKDERENFVLVFTGTDRVGHFFLWNAYDQPNHPYHDAFIDHFHQIDAVIGEISSRLNPDDGLFIFPDHGFESVRKSVCVNRFLVDQGFLTVNSDQAKSFNDIGDWTRAFAPIPARIYVQTAGRYPRGCGKREDRKSVISDLIQAIES